MKIVAIEMVEDCFDGGHVYRFQFDVPFSKLTIESLAPLGEVEYFPRFPRPFFRVRSASGLHLQGVQGERDCRVVLPRDGQATVQHTLEEHWGWTVRDSEKDAP